MPVSSASLVASGCLRQRDQAGDARRVDPRRKRERAKPERNRIAHTLSLRGPRSDRIDVGDSPLGTRRLRDQLNRHCSTPRARQPLSAESGHELGSEAGARCGTTCRPSASARRSQRWSVRRRRRWRKKANVAGGPIADGVAMAILPTLARTCLLYTSDAADE